MKTCDCTSTQPAPEALLALERFDFAPLLRTLRALSVQASASGVQPLSSLDNPEALDRIVFEGWPYLAELLSLYDRVIDAENYISTADLQVKGLASIISYAPRPATSAVGTLIADANNRSCNLQGPLAFHASTPSSTSPARIEPEKRGPISSAVNTLRIAQIRAPEAPAHFYLESSSAAPVRGAPLLFMWKESAISLHGTEIQSIDTFEDLSGEQLIEIQVTTPPSIPNSTALNDISLLSPSQRAYTLPPTFKRTHDDKSAVTEGDPFYSDSKVYGGLLQLFIGGYKGSVAIPIPGKKTKTASVIFLDGVYHAIAPGDILIIQSGPSFHAARVVNTGEMSEPLKDLDSVHVPVTNITISPALPANFVTKDTTNRLIIHYNFHDIGRLTRPAKHLLAPADLLNKEILLEGLYDPPPPGLEPKELILQDANGVGVLVKGTLAFKEDGSATMTITEGEWDEQTMLRVPVTVHGNVLHVSVGETVRDEVLGDGDASIPFQSFQLKKYPLTYLAADNERGYASTLEVRVGGVLWEERTSFYRASPTDRVYVVRHDDEQRTTITFGDGIRGARPSTGKANVRASYRFGGGAAPIPAGSVTQIVRGAPGLVRVYNPAPLTGGSDRESPRQIRKNGPASALVLGRLVGLPDFGARAQATPGVLQSKVERAWDKRAQQAVAKVWFIPTAAGGDDLLAARLRRGLEALAEEGTIVQAVRAQPIDERLRITVVVDPARLHDDVIAAVHAVLSDPEDGLLALANARIGGTLMRAELAAAIRSVPGVLDIHAINLAAGPFPAPGLRAYAGRYFDFLGPDGNSTIIDALDPERRPCTNTGS